jgi:hypothetical protein
MPRKSAAARVLEVWQSSPKPLPAPAHLSPTARRLWDDIVVDRPADHFRPGARELLASYCAVSAELEQLWQREQEFQDDLVAHGRIIRCICALTAQQTKLCGDLRLTLCASIERHSAKREARGDWVVVDGQRLRKPWED